MITKQVDWAMHWLTLKVYRELMDCGQGLVSGINTATLKI
jgi:hypothetical protein